MRTYVFRTYDTMRTMRTYDTMRTYSKYGKCDNTIMKERLLKGRY